MLWASDVFFIDSCELNGERLDASIVAFSEWLLEGIVNVLDMVDWSDICLGLASPFTGYGFVSYNKELSYWPGPGWVCLISELNLSLQVPNGTDP